MLKFTEEEIKRKSELRALIAADPKSTQVSEWMREQRDIVSAAHARSVQRAGQKRAKAEEKEEESRVEVVKPEDMLSPDELTESQENRARIQELRTEIAAATRKKKTADLQDELDDLIDREGELWRRAERRAIKSGKCLPTPKREDHYDDDDFDEAMEWHRLNLAEAGCYRKSNSAKTSFNLRKAVEKELQLIEKKRRTLRPDEFEPEPNSEASSVIDSDEEKIKDTKPAPSPADMSDVKLREEFSKQRFFFRDFLGFTDRGELIAALEAEIRRRRLPLYWSARGTRCMYVDEAGNLLTSIASHVYMGEVDRPDLVPEPEPELKAIPTLTTFQRTAREQWSNQHGSYLDYPKQGSVAEADVIKNTPPVRSFTFVYMLADSLKFWPWGEIQTGPLPRGTQVLRAPDPPGYCDGSHVLPDGVSFDEHHSVWRKS